MKYLLIFCSLLLIGAGCDKSYDAPSTPDLAVQEEYSVEQQVVFAYLEPKEWANYRIALSSIRELEPNQFFESGIVYSPYEENISYFATSSRQDDNSYLLSVYRYDNENHNFERLYKTFSVEGESGLTGKEDIDMHEILRVIGIDGNELIMLAQPIDDSPHPCAQPLVIGAQGGTRALVSFELDNPYATFNYYKPSEEILGPLRHERDMCIS